MELQHMIGRSDKSCQHKHGRRSFQFQMKHEIRSGINPVTSFQLRKVHKYGVKIP